MYLNMYTCVYIYIYVHVSIYMYMKLCTCIQSHIHVCVRKYTYKTARSKPARLPQENWGDCQNKTRETARVKLRKLPE